MYKLTAEEIEKMRELVADHDATTNEETDFDPSKVRVPYKFQKFPMMVYDHERSFPAHDEEKMVTRGSLAVAEITHVKAHLVSRVVKSQHELDAALAAGWQEEPPEFEVQYVDPKAELAAEVADADEHLERGGTIANYEPRPRRNGRVVKTEA